CCSPKTILLKVRFVSPSSPSLGSWYTYMVLCHKGGRGSKMFLSFLYYIKMHTHTHTHTHRPLTPLVASCGSCKLDEIHLSPSFVSSSPFHCVKSGTLCHDVFPRPS